MNGQELRVRAQSVGRLCNQEGWPYLESEWFMEREKIIELIKKAVEAGETNKAAYAGAELAGFDRALKVPSRFRELMREFMDEDRQKEKENVA